MANVRDSDSTPGPDVEAVQLSAAVFLSPTTTVVTADTHGTGATGSTEEPGQATRSLVASVDARLGSGASSSWSKLDRQDDVDYIATSSSSVSSDVDNPPPPVTNSQEADGLAQSVTRSQTDFTRWLEDTMRLARGDGSSIFDADDALSSILDATRETRFGHSEADECATPYDSVLETPIQLEASLHPIEDELSHERDRDGLKVDDSEHVPHNEEVQADVEEITNANGASVANVVKTSSSYGWKLFSLSLSIALAHSLRRQHALSRSLRPTPSIRFVPDSLDNVTTTYSPLATPLPVAESLAVSVYAIVLTLLAALIASARLLLRSSPASPASIPTRSTSPLVDLNGDAVLSARERYERGQAHAESCRYELAISTLTPILDLACAPLDKALASEALGACHYVVARRADNSVAKYKVAQALYERSVRLDPSRAAPRLGLGKVKYRLGDYRGAVKAFEVVVSRDQQCSLAHEWLAKSLYRLESPARPQGGRNDFVRIEHHLERAISLNPQSYHARAFLGEILHLRGGQTERARKVLESSVALRVDQPQVHARLAFIANERLDPTLAAKHFRLVLETRPRGRVDESCPGSLEAVRGISPHLSLYFITPQTDRSERLRVLDRALCEYPHDDLVRLLHAVQRDSLAISTTTTDPGLQVRARQLRHRSERFPDDALAKGLSALSLLALGRAEEAHDVYSSFWSQIGAGRRHERGTESSPLDDSDNEKYDRSNEHDDDGEKRKVAFLVMTFWEMKQEASSRGSDPDPVQTMSDRMSSSVDEKPRAVQVQGRERKKPAEQDSVENVRPRVGSTTSRRRSSRLQSRN